MRSLLAHGSATKADLRLKLASVFNNGASALIVLALGMSVSLAVAYQMSREIERDTRLRFASTVTEAHEAIGNQVRAYADVLFGARALFFASDHVRRNEFRTYIESLDLRGRYPGIQVIHYAQRVLASERSEVESLVRNDRSVNSDGYRHFAVKPPGNKSEYVIVQYVEPTVGNEAALGLDLRGDPVRLRALERARDSGQLTASGAIALALDPRRHPGFAMRLPIYRKGMPIDTVDQRRAAFSGMVSTSFVVIDLMRGVLSEQVLRTMHVRIRDAGFLDSPPGLQQPSVDNLMFDSDRLLPAGSSQSSASDTGLAHLSAAKALEVGGRRWDLLFSAREGFIAPHVRLLPWAMFLLGTIISSLLFALVRSLATSGRRALNLAESITGELRASEASRGEAQRMTQQLVESLPNPIFFKGADGRYLGVNRAWENYFGIPRELIIGKTVYDLHPANRAVADRRQAMDQNLWDHPGTQSFETSLVTPDGERHDALYYKATYTRHDGSVAGLVGTIIDITERKKLEQQFQATFDQAAVGIAHFDLQRRSIKVNRRYSEIVGYAPEELIGRKLGFLDHQDDRGMGHEQRCQLLSGAIDHYAQEKRYIRKDGKVIWVTRTESLARDAAHSPRYFIRVIEDITERKEAAEHYRATFDNAPVGIMHTAIDNDAILHANSRLRELLGYTQAELVHMMPDQLVHPDHMGADQDNYRERMLNGEIDTYRSERQYRRKDGSNLWVNRTVALARNAAGEPLYFIRVIEDISERKQSEKRQVMEHAVTHVLADAETLAEAIPRIIQTICETLAWHCGSRWAHDEATGMTRCFECWGVDSPEIQGFIVENSRRAVNQDGTGQGLVRQAVLTREPVWVADLSQVRGFNRAHMVAKAELHGAFCFPLLVGNQVLGVMEFFHRDVREPDPMLIHAAKSMGSQIGQYIARQQVEERVRHLAHYDELTGLPNRTMFNERLGHALAGAQRTEGSLVVLFIDLDRFKNINDTLGHDAGDHVLKEVAQRLRGCLRASDTVGRLGGDEFVVLLEEPPRSLNAAIVAQKMLVALGKPFPVQSQEFHITASIGISSYPDDGTDMQTLMKNADIAMYRAKEQGKDNFQFYSAQINGHSIERLTLESSLRRALERSEFLLHYQPKLDLGTGRVTGVEALVRWQQPERGLIPPAQFIQLAEETGLIVPIGEWVLKTACAQNKTWQQQGLPPVRVAVNLSARQFAHADLLQAVSKVLKETGLDPAFLEFEITESMVMHNPKQAIVLLNKLKAIGIHLAIDDFGTGYSSLGYLKRFPLNSLKIDRAFIRDLPGDSDDVAITQAIIAMAHSLRLSVVAEGVETAEQQDFLRDHDCDEIQGYYFSKPKPAADIALLLQENAAAVSKPQPEQCVLKFAAR
jgi:diguanylate cyclase (GGDEF)-like protein/PAS domain S-box-containing protein